MQLQTFMRLMKNRRAPLLLGVHFISRAVYRANFLAAASESGLLKHFAQRPLSFDEIADAVGCTREQHETLVDWLSVAVLSGILKRTRDGKYALRGIFARSLAAQHNEDAAAALEEITQLHASLIYNMPTYLKKKHWLTLKDHDAVVAARASRALEPIMAEAVEQAVDRFKPKSYIDVGCGTGVYLSYALRKDPNLRGKGVDLNPDVAQTARDRLKEWGFGDRSSVDAGDFRKMEPRGEHDLASLINNICYFEPDKRVETVKHLARFVRPGGGVLLAHPLRGINAASEVVSLFFAAIKDAGPFPAMGEMEDVMARAGLKNVQTHTVIPGIVGVTAQVPS